MEKQVGNQEQRVFIISLDGATFSVLHPLIEQGYMPNLGRFLESGLSADLESVVPPVTAPAWSSYMTGKNPNQHGIFDFTRFDFADYQNKLNNSQHIRSKTIWQILSEKGKRVVVLNLPYTYPVYQVNGVMVAGWDAPTTSAFTYPSELGREILETIPDYGSTLDLSLWNYLPTESETEFSQFVAKLVRSFEQGRTLATHFLQDPSWDVFMVHFQQTDWIQHKLWGEIERACTNPNDKSRRVESVRQCYRVFDQHVGALLAEIAPLNATTVILSDHGFGPCRGTICPNYLLAKAGYYRLQEQAESKLKRWVKHSSSSHVRNLYRSMANARKALRGRKAARKYKSWADLANDNIPRQKVPVDWPHTKAALTGGSETAFVWINVIGRGPFGCVKPGAEYENLVSELLKKFNDMRNPSNGQKLFNRVARGEEVYAGAAEGVLLPDLVLFPDDNYVISAMFSEPFLPDTGAEGKHRHNGVVMLQGEQIKRQVANFRPNLIDLAPTILHLAGLPVPADMDGRVLTEMLAASLEVQYEQADNRVVQPAREYTEAEAELIEQRLRGLGYVE